MAAGEQGNWMQHKRRQAAGTLNFCVLPTRLSDDYISDASEKHEQSLINVGRPEKFISNPVPTKREWDAIS